MLYILSISLSLDALAVAFAHGLKSTKIPILSKLLICFISIFYFGAAVWLGEKISNFLSPDFAKITGIILMMIICLWMLFQIITDKSPKNEQENKKITDKKTLLNISIKPVGITFQIIKNPMLCDIDNSKSICIIEAIFLGTALSIDSISVGIGYSLLGTVSIFAPLIVGLFQFLFLSIGNFLGLKFKQKNFKHLGKLQIISVAVMFILTIIRFFD